MLSSAAFRQYLIAIVGGMSMFITGTSFTWATPLLPQLKSKGSEFHMTADECSWMISLVEIGCLLPSIQAGFLADRFGRKTCLLYGTPVYIGTWLMVLWWRTAPSLYFMRFMQGGLAMFVTGSSFTWATPILPQLRSNESEFQLTADQTSWVITLVEIGCLVPSIPAGFLADRFGRKTCLLYVTPVFILTWLLILWWRNFASLCFMRFVHGTAISIHYTILPVYLTEVASPSRRGALANFFSVMWYLGFLFDYIVGTFFDYDGLTWFCLAPPVVFMVGFHFCPESPYFLMMRNRRGEAVKTLAWLESKSLEEIEPDLVAIEQSILEEKESKGSWKDVTATTSGRKALGIILVMAVFYVMCGLSAILSYVSEIFSSLSGNENAANLLSVLSGSVVLLGTVISGVLSDRLGRRSIIIYFGVLTALCLIVTSIFYYLDEKTGMDMSSYTWMPYVSILSFILTAPIAVGVIQALQGELFSNSTRGFAAGIYTLWLTFINCFSMKLYQVIGDNVGYYVNYLAYAVFTLGGVVYAFMYLPETKGKTFDEVQAVLQKRRQC